MKQNNLKSSIRKFTPQKRRAVAEVISSLLLVAITVVGAVILTTFLDEAFVSGSLAVTSSDNSLKTIKLIAYDTRDGSGLFEYAGLDNEDPTDQYLRRDCVDITPACVTIGNTKPSGGGTEFLVIQIENRSLNSIWLKNVYLDNVGHVWDVSIDPTFDPTVATSGGGAYPEDGMFSILPTDGTFIQNQDNQIKGGQTVNVLIKLDSVNPDIPLSKTIRVQLNIGTNTLQEFWIESGGAQ